MVTLTDAPGVRVFVEALKMTESLMSLLAIQAMGPTEAEVSPRMTIHCGALVPPVQLGFVGSRLAGLTVKVGTIMGLGCSPGNVARKIIIKPSRRSAKSQPLSRTVSCIRRWCIGESSSLSQHMAHDQSDLFNVELLPSGRLP